jgi:hypothetical protein
MDRRVQFAWIGDVGDLRQQPGDNVERVDWRPVPLVYLSFCRPAPGDPGAGTFTFLMLKRLITGVAPTVRRPLTLALAFQNTLRTPAVLLMMRVVFTQPETPAAMRARLVVDAYHRIPRFPRRRHPQEPAASSLTADYDTEETARRGISMEPRKEEAAQENQRREETYAKEDGPGAQVMPELVHSTLTKTGHSEVGGHIRIAVAVPHLIYRRCDT